MVIGGSKLQMDVDVVADVSSDPAQRFPLAILSDDLLNSEVKNYGNEHGRRMSLIRSFT